MITLNPYSAYHAIRPGHLPEPMKRVHTCDPQECIDACLECIVPGGCKPTSRKCLLKADMGKRQRRTARTIERDKKILELLNAGWRRGEICEELRIGKTTYREAKNRLKAMGELV